MAKRTMNRKNWPQPIVQSYDESNIVIHKMKRVKFGVIHVDTKDRVRDIWELIKRKWEMTGSKPVDKIAEKKEEDAGTTDN